MNNARYIRIFFIFLIGLASLSPAQAEPQVDAVEAFFDEKHLVDHAFFDVHCYEYNSTFPTCFFFNRGGYILTKDDIRLGLLAYLYEMPRGKDRPLAKVGDFMTILLVLLRAKFFLDVAFFDFKKVPFKPFSVALSGDNIEELSTTWLGEVELFYSSKHKDMLLQEEFKEIKFRVDLLSAVLGFRNKLRAKDSRLFPDWAFKTERTAQPQLIRNWRLEFLKQCCCSLLCCCKSRNNRAAIATAMR